MDCKASLTCGTHALRSGSVCYHGITVFLGVIVIVGIHETKTLPLYLLPGIAVAELFLTAHVKALKVRHIELRVFNGHCYVARVNMTQWLVGANRKWT